MSEASVFRSLFFIIQRRAAQRAGRTCRASSPAICVNILPSDCIDQQFRIPHEDFLVSDSAPLREFGGSGCVSSFAPTGPQCADGAGSAKGGGGRCLSENKHQSRPSPVSASRRASMSGHGEPLTIKVLHSIHRMPPRRSRLLCRSLPEALAS